MPDCVDFVLHEPSSPTGKLYSQHDKGNSGFLLVHESPTTNRRSLRASRELSETEVAALTELLEPLKTEAESAPEAASISIPTIFEDDEVGLRVAPISAIHDFVTAVPEPKPSYKNGRRVCEEPLSPSSPPHSKMKTMTHERLADSSLPSSPTGSLGASANSKTTSIRREPLPDLFAEV